MRICILQNEEVNVKDSWSDLTTGEYIKMLDLYSNSQEMVAELFLVKFISILTGKDENFISGLYEEELLDFQEIILSFQDNPFCDEEKKSFILDGRLYSWVIPNKLTMGEKISIKLLEKESKGQYDQWLNLLSILVRPAVEKTNEFGEIYYDIEPFDGDINILTRRKELFKDIPGINSMYIIKAFTDGRQI